MRTWRSTRVDRSTLPDHFVDWLRDARCPCETTSTDFSGLTNFDNHNVFVYGGADVTLGIQSYSRTDEHDPNHGCVATSMSRCWKYAVASQSHRSRWPNRDLSSIFLDAHYGGQLLLPMLNKVDTGMVFFDAHGTGGLIDIPSLASFTGSSMEIATDSGFEKGHTSMRHC